MKKTNYQEEFFKKKLEFRRKLKQEMLSILSSIGIVIMFFLAVFIITGAMLGWSNMKENSELRTEIIKLKRDINNRPSYYYYFNVTNLEDNAASLIQYKMTR